MSSKNVSFHYISTLPELLVVDTVVGVSGAVAFFSCILSLITLLSSKLLLNRYTVIDYNVLPNYKQIFLFLAIADTINALAMVLVGINHVNMFSNVISCFCTPFTTSWQCATLAWRFSKNIGDIWPPVLLLFITVEMGFMITTPKKFNQNGNSAFKLLCIFASIIITIILAGTGLRISSLNSDLEVDYMCGKSSAYSPSYSKFILYYSIFCNSLAFVLSLIAYVKCKIQGPLEHWTKHRAILNFMLCVTTAVFSVFPCVVKLWFPGFFTSSFIIEQIYLVMSSCNSGVKLLVMLNVDQEFADNFCDTFSLSSLRRPTSATVVFIPSSTPRR